MFPDTLQKLQGLHDNTGWGVGGVRKGSVAVPCRYCKDTVWVLLRPQESAEQRFLNALPIGTLTSSVPSLNLQLSFSAAAPVTRKPSQTRSELRAHTPLQGGGATESMQACLALARPRCNQPTVFQNTTSRQNTFPRLKMATWTETPMARAKSHNGGLDEHVKSQKHDPERNTHGRHTETLDENHLLNHRGLGNDPVNSLATLWQGTEWPALEAVEPSCNSTHSVITRLDRKLQQCARSAGPQREGGLAQDKLRTRTGLDGT